MIPHSVEERIKRLLKEGVSYKKIAATEGVSRATAKRIARVCDIAARVDEKANREIRGLLLAKWPVGAIEARTRVPKSVISAIRRTMYLRHGTSKPVVTEGDPRKCPTCKAIIFMDRSQEAGRTWNLSSATSDRCREFHALLCDVVSLNDLKVVTNPLFYHLATRIEKALEEANG